MNRVNTARFRYQFASEWIKVLSLRSAYGLAAVAVAASVSSAVFLSGRMHLSDFGKATYDPLVDEFNTGVWSTLMLAAACVGAMAATGEFHSGLMRTTAVAVPGRVRTLLAKAAAFATFAGIVGVVADVCGFGISRALLAGEGIDTTLSTEALSNALISTALALPVAAVLGLAFGTVLRHPAVATLTAVVVLAVLPGLLPANGRGFPATVSNAVPYHAWRALVGQAADGGVVPLQPPSEAFSWIWFCAWPCLALLAAALVHRRRDL